MKSPRVLWQKLRRALGRTPYIPREAVEVRTARGWEPASYRAPSTAPSGWHWITLNGVVWWVPARDLRRPTGKESIR